MGGEGRGGLKDAISRMHACEVKVEIAKRGKERGAEPRPRTAECTQSAFIHNMARPVIGRERGGEVRREIQVLSLAWAAGMGWFDSEL